MSTVSHPDDIPSPHGGESSTLDNTLATSNPLYQAAQTHQSSPSVTVDIIKGSQHFRGESSEHKNGSMSLMATANNGHQSQMHQHIMLNNNAALPPQLASNGSLNNSPQGSTRKKFPPPTLVPFGSTEERLHNKQPSVIYQTPGPGAYAMVPEFVNSKYDRKMDEGNSFIIKDNGHINQRPQIYAAAKGSRDALMPPLGIIENPGPGSYETNTSSFVDNTTIRGLKQQQVKLIKSPSPRNQSLAVFNQNASQGGSNSALRHHQNNPYGHQDSQPLTTATNMPHMQHHRSGGGIMAEDASNANLSNQSYEGLLNPRMKRLVMAASKHIETNLGPGTYNVQDGFVRQSPKSNLKFGICKTLRAEITNKNTTLPQVGPGSYEFWSKDPGHKIPNPTFPRDPQSRSVFGPAPKRAKKNRNASIRENFEDYSDSDSEDAGSISALSVPGPGSYMKELSTFGKNTAKSETFQFFGSNVERFKNNALNTGMNSYKAIIGPGSYNSTHKPQSYRQQIFQLAGSSSFMNSSRKPVDIFSKPVDEPGPGEYNPIKPGIIDPEFKLQDQSKAAFKSKVDRFHVPEEKRPDPGKYNVPSAFNPNSTLKNVPLASYRSGTRREIQFDFDLEVPGIGVYNPQDYKSIGIQKIQGGAPNNFSLLAKKNTSLGVPHIDTNKDRCIYAETSTPANVGPGLYGSEKFKHLRENSPRRDSSSGILLASTTAVGANGLTAQQSSLFGAEKRFKDQKILSPGPGQYAEVNKWHKKTYNLKFLNVAQMCPAPQGTPCVS